MVHGGWREITGLGAVAEEKREKESEVELPAVPTPVVSEAQTRGPGFGESLRNTPGKVTDLSRLHVSPSVRLSSGEWLLKGC